MRNGFKPFIKKTGKIREDLLALPSQQLCIQQRGQGVRASFHPHHPQSAFVLFTPLHGLTQVSLQIWPRYHWDHFWDSSSFPLSPACVPAILVTQFQLDTALPTALSSLRAIRIDDFQAPCMSLWGSDDSEGEGPTGKQLFPALPGPTGGRAWVLSQGMFKSRAYEQTVRDFFQCSSLNDGLDYIPR